MSALLGVSVVKYCSLKVACAYRELAWLNAKMFEMLGLMKMGMRVQRGRIYMFHFSLECRRRGVGPGHQTYMAIAQWQLRCCAGQMIGPGPMPLHARGYVTWASARHTPIRLQMVWGVVTHVHMLYACGAPTNCGRDHKQRSRPQTAVGTTNSMLRGQLEKMTHQAAVSRPTN